MISVDQIHCLSPPMTMDYQTTIKKLKNSAVWTHQRCMIYDKVGSHFCKVLILFIEMEFNFCDCSHSLKFKCWKVKGNES